jgi:hypothetical protein
MEAFVSMKKSPLGIIIIGSALIGAMLIVMSISLYLNGDFMLAESVYLLVGVSLPIVFVGVFRWPGVVLGAVALWGSQAASGVLMTYLDSPLKNLPGSAIMNDIWVYLGWLFGAIYSLAILYILRIVKILE